MKKIACHVVAKLLSTACAASVGLTILLTISPTASAETPSLKDTFKDSFLVGAALNPAQFSEEDARSATLVKAQFNAITPENVLKWEKRVHPQPDSYSFELPDRYVSFGEKNHMFIVGHTLVWHNQVPAWVFQDENGNPADREALLKRMRRPHPHRRGPLPRPHQRLGRRQRSPRGRRYAAPNTLAENYRRRLHRQSIPIRARS